jgi:hypothetical protein
MGIVGNETADRLADLEAHQPQDISGLTAEPTISGLQSDARHLRCKAEAAWWATQKPKISTWYKKWELPYKTTPQAQLSLTRPILAKLLAMRTTHRDFAWYHQKFKHDDAILSCVCGKDKSPNHLVHYPRMRRRFRQWPMRPVWPPSDTKEGIIYLNQLLSGPEDFADFIRLAERA